MLLSTRPISMHPLDLRTGGRRLLHPKGKGSSCCHRRVAAGGTEGRGRAQEGLHHAEAGQEREEARRGPRRRHHRFFPGVCLTSRPTQHTRRRLWGCPRALSGGLAVGVWLGRGVGVCVVCVCKAAAACNFFPHHPRHSGFARPLPQPHNTRRSRRGTRATWEGGQGQGGKEDARVGWVWVELVGGACVLWWRLRSPSVRAAPAPAAHAFPIQHNLAITCTQHRPKDNMKGGRPQGQEREEVVRGGVCNAIPSVCFPTHCLYILLSHTYPTLQFFSRGFFVSSPRCFVSSTQQKYTAPPPPLLAPTYCSSFTTHALYIPPSVGLTFGFSFSLCSGHHPCPQHVTHPSSSWAPFTFPAPAAAPFACASPASTPTPSAVSERWGARRVPSVRWS